MHGHLNVKFKPLNAELNPIFHLPALLGAHHIFHVSGLTVKLLLLSITNCHIYAILIGDCVLHSLKGI